MGGCVNHDIAEQLKAKVPNIECDGTSNNDDDDNDDGTRSDDKVTPTTDDDVAPNDDATPNDYWKCLMKYDSLDQCTEGGCAWCVSIYIYTVYIYILKQRIESDID